MVRNSKNPTTVEMNMFLNKMRFSQVAMVGTTEIKLDLTIASQFTVARRKTIMLLARRTFHRR